MAQHLAPTVGSTIDARLPALPGANNFSFAYPRDLLAKKITDINGATGGVGDYLLMAMKYYNWVLLDFPLVPVDPQDGIVVLPAGAQLVQVANRFQRTIRIHADSWNKMDDANKVALLIHEAIYSLLNVEANSLPSAYKAREITGLFFKPTELLPKGIYAYLSASLAIPVVAVPLNVIRAPVLWEVSSPSSFPFPETPDHLRAALDLHRPGLTVDDLNSFAVRACTAAIKWNIESFLSKITPTIHVQSLEYVASDPGADKVMQTRIAISDVRSSIHGETVVGRYGDLNSCMYYLGFDVTRASREL